MIKYETDSRKVLKGQTFVAIKGATVDGHDFINEAILNGASFIICEREIDCEVPILVVDDSALFLKERLVEEYSEKLSQLKLIGVTGTNGKTTTCYLTYQLLQKLGVKVAYMGTIGFYYESMQIELPNTTPDILTIYKLFLECLEKGCTTVVMEVSSHALALDRIAGLKFDIGAFTNLTEDHLDYHKSMENYLQTKLEFLRYMKENGIFIVNQDDTASKYFRDRFKNTESIGFENALYTVSNASIQPDHTDLTFILNHQEYVVRTHLTSRFNVYNYLMSLAICRACGFSVENIISKTDDIYPPRGRCETYKVGEGYAVIDYAHTPDALEKVIQSYQELPHNKIITVVGCGGDRDALKRPIMGRIATEESDFVIFTNDNPRGEDETKIMEDILVGVKKNNYEVVYDRHEAICRALDKLQKEDIALILGKGHEDYQIIGHDKIHFDDKEEVLEYKKRRGC